MEKGWDGDNSAARTEVVVAPAVGRGHGGVRGHDPGGGRVRDRHGGPLRLVQDGGGGLSGVEG